jgi:tRNA G46 methylase TrmB
LWNPTVKKPRLFRQDRIAPPAALADFRLAWAKRPAAGRRVPIDLEVGCGVGWRAIRQARSSPKRLLIAVEKTREKFEKFRSRLQRNAAKAGGGFPNLFPVHADAVAFTVHALADESLDRVMFFYPNPCVRNPASRWLRMPFFGYLLTKLRPGAEVILRTNVRAYFEEAERLAVEAWNLERVSTRSFSRDEVAPAEAETHFERKYLERGETCYEAIFRKPSAKSIATSD